MAWSMAVYRQVEKNQSTYSVGGAEVSKKWGSTAGMMISGAPSQPKICCFQ